MGLIWTVTPTASCAPSSKLCRKRGWRFCFIGGIALQRWGEPRLTGDVDLTILTGFGDEAGYIEELCHGFGGRVPDVAEFALRNRVLLLRSAQGIPNDIRRNAQV